MNIEGIMVYKFESNGKKIKFEEGGKYYITDRYPTMVGGLQYHWPILVECVCIETDPDDWDFKFQLKEERNIIPSDYMASSYQHPDSIHEDDWGEYFQESIKEGWDKFYREYKENPKRFFNLLFNPTQR